jgi:LPXTG-site transpeptidase (sortase) family protein
MKTNKTKNKKSKRFITFIFIILLIATIVVAGIFIADNMNIVQLNKEAADYLDELEKLHISLDDENRNEVENPDINATVEVIDSEENGTSNKSYMRGISSENRVYKGYSVAGKIEMPSVNLRYPILDTMTNANALDVSVCIQYGGPLNSVGNTIIIGHNYKNGLFFGSNKNMKNGDQVYITNYATGVKKTYSIYSIYQTEESDTSFYNRDTGGKSEITLVTCQNNNKYRLVIKAKEI